MTKKYTFNVGDKVKDIGNSHYKIGEHQPETGDIYTISSREWYEGEEAYGFIEDGKKCKNPFWVRVEDNFELVEKSNPKKKTKPIKEKTYTKKDIERNREALHEALMGGIQ